MTNHITVLKNETASKSSEITLLGRTLKEIQIERNSLKDKLSNFEASHAKMASSFE